MKLLWMSRALASVKYYVMFFKIIIKKKKIKITLNLSIYAIYFLVLMRRRWSRRYFPKCFAIFWPKWGLQKLFSYSNSTFHSHKFIFLLLFLFLPHIILLCSAHVNQKPFLFTNNWNSKIPSVHQQIVHSSWQSSSLATQPSRQDMFHLLTDSLSVPCCCCCSAFSCCCYCWSCQKQSGL